MSSGGVAGPTWREVFQESVRTFGGQSTVRRATKRVVERLPELLPTDEALEVLAMAAGQLLVLTDRRLLTYKPRRGEQTSELARSQLRAVDFRSTFLGGWTLKLAVEGGAQLEFSQLTPWSQGDRLYRLLRGARSQDTVELLGDDRPHDPGVPPIGAWTALSLYPDRDYRG